MRNNRRYCNIRARVHVYMQSSRVIDIWNIFCLLDGCMENTREEFLKQRSNFAPSFSYVVEIIKYFVKISNQISKSVHFFLLLLLRNSMNILTWSICKKIYLLKFLMGRNYESWILLLLNNIGKFIYFLLR